MWNPGSGDGYVTNHVPKCGCAVTVDLTLVLNNKHSAIPAQTVQTDLDNLALANGVLATAAIADAAASNPKLLAQANTALRLRILLSCLGLTEIALKLRRKNLGS